MENYLRRIKRRHMSMIQTVCIPRSLKHIDAKYLVFRTVHVKDDSLVLDSSRASIYWFKGQLLYTSQGFLVFWFLVSFNTYIDKGCTKIGETLE